MTATNHVVTGALMTAAITNPWIALPLALLAHFALDMLPHYGDIQHPDKALARLKWMLPIDASIAFLVLLAIVFTHPVHWVIIALGGVLCASPDLWQIPRYLRYLKTKNVAPLDDWLSQFHTRIQWGERPWGIGIEFLWFLTFGYMLLAKL